MRHQPAVRDHVEQELRERRGGERHAAGLVVDGAGGGIDAHEIAGADLVDLAAHQHRQAEIQRVAIEDAAIGARQHGGDAEMLERLGGLLARGADAKALAGDHHVARLHRAREIRIDGFQAMRGDGRDRMLHIDAGREHVGVDAVAVDEGAAELRALMTASRADRKCGRARRRPPPCRAIRDRCWRSRVPMRPLKLRAIEEMQVTFSASVPL